ncbi:MAG: hypothetical protein OXF59_09420 [Pseudomonas sp.]|nr:hypothetical protein [Pseudomonas sp.]
MTKKDPVSNEKWVKFDDDTEVLLAGIDNDAYQVALERMRRRLQRNDAMFEEGQVGVVEGERTEHQNHCLLLGHFIVKDWTGVEDVDGNPVKFSPQTAAELLDSSIEFFVFTLKQAGQISADARAERADTVGKQSPASNGSASGAGTRKKGARSSKS